MTTSPSQSRDPFKCSRGGGYNGVCAETANHPPPALEQGKSLMQSLKDRLSIRDYSDQALAQQALSNLLWAAWGVNRPQIDGRTAPRSRSVYAFDIYLAMADDVWCYEPKSPPDRIPHRRRSIRHSRLGKLADVSADNLE